jgi:hypothetical protein
VQTLIAQAEACLQEAMTRWRDLRDPEVQESNFIHPETGEEYNYRAEETYRVLKELQGGLLTCYPLQPAQLTSPLGASEPAMLAVTPSATTQPESPNMTSPRVLISYSWDSDEHSRRVRELSKRLRTDGIDCCIDQYVQNPAEGWPLWMNNQVEESAFVLVVFTERYTHRSMNPQKSGVRFESVLILQDLYDAGMINDKFIPVVFEQGAVQHIMKWLKPYSHYVLDTDGGYDLLRRRLLNDPAVPTPTLGIPATKGPAR